MQNPAFQRRDLCYNRNRERKDDSQKDIVKPGTRDKCRQNVCQGDSPGEVL